MAAAAARPGPAARRPARRLAPDEVTHADPPAPNPALVFNVGAGSEPATASLDTLADKDFAGTFCVMGWWAERHPDLLARIGADGHQIGSHGHSVFDLTQVSDARVQADLETADPAINAVTGRSTRPLWSPSGGSRGQRVRRIAFDLGSTTSTALVLPHLIDDLRAAGDRLVTVGHLLGDNP